MKPVLFLATIRDSWKSILIFSLILFGYGIMMMLIFPSVEDMTGDWMTEAEGIALTETSGEDAVQKTFNLTWDLKAGAGEHVAISTSNPMLHELFRESIQNGSAASATASVTQAMFIEALSNQTAMDQMGIRVLYVGRLNYVEFTQQANESYFFTVYLAGGGNYTPVAISEQIWDGDLTNMGGFEDWLNSPFIEGFVGRIDFDMTTTEGFMSVEFFSMWPLFFLIYIGIKAGGTVAPHVEDKSLDMLLATGYSRNRFLAEKLGVLAVNLVVINIAALLGILAGAAVIGEAISLEALLVTFAGTLPVGVAFIGIGLVLSMLLDEGSKVTWVIMGLVVGMYVIDIVTNVVDALWADVLGYLSLFDYYDAVSLMIDKSMPLHFWLIPTVIGLVGIVAAFYLFQKKEIHA